MRKTWKEAGTSTEKGSSPGKWCAGHWQRCCSFGSAPAIQDLFDITKSSHWCQSWVAGLAQVASPKSLGLQTLSCHTVANCKAGSWKEFCSNESKRYGFGWTVLGRPCQPLKEESGLGTTAFVGSWVMQPTIFSQNKMNISEIHSTRKNHSLKQMLLVLAVLTAPSVSVLPAGLLLVLNRGTDGQTKHIHRYPSLENLLIIWWGGSRCKLAKDANKLPVEAH